MYYLGLDFGTSGARATIIDDSKTRIWSAQLDYAAPQQQEARDWQDALFALLAQIPATLRPALQAIAIDGTSGTVLLADADLHPVTPALPYNHPLAGDPAAKLAWLKQHQQSGQARYLMHQVDYLNALLTGIGGISDYHNALKSGFNVQTLDWQDGIYNSDDRALLPRIVAPGTILGKLQRRIARHYNLNPACVVRAGTTDSIAAFIAAEVDTPGIAVTSLGSTLALKLLSKQYVASPQHGVYSHKWGDAWLVSGASNSGGAVLRQFFSDDELALYSARIQPQIASALDYYPLPCTGERFPVNDPELMPRLTPRPADNAVFLHGLLEGIANIERQAYARFAELGATPLRQVITAGGGSRNPHWQIIRQRLLRVSVTVAANTDAAFGSAILAKGLDWIHK
ncbi:MAG: FGGY-family carbohydrate kinase [Sulfuriferula sp.]|nr:FGGY-family carbohydrate kinase [Sulfuriferula sp.]